MSRRLVVVLVLLGMVTIVASAWRVLLRPTVHTPLEFPCLDSPAAGWLTAQSERSLLRLEWDGDGGGRVGIAPAGDTLVVWTPMPEAEVRRTAREVTEPLRRNVSSDSFDSVSLLIACDANLTPWAGETTEVMGYRPCLEWPLEKIPSCLAEVRKERSTVVDWRAGAVGERIDAQSQKRGLKLPPREPSLNDYRYRPPWGGTPVTE